MTYREPPEGWKPFGTYAAYPNLDNVTLEFSEELGEDLLPLWERQLPCETECRCTHWEAYCYHHARSIEKCCRCGRLWEEGLSFDFTDRREVTPGD